MASFNSSILKIKPKKVPKSEKVQSSNLKGIDDFIMTDEIPKIKKMPESEVPKIKKMPESEVPSARKPGSVIKVPEAKQAMEALKPEDMAKLSAKLSASKAKKAVEKMEEKGKITDNDKKMSGSMYEEHLKKLKKK